MPAGDRPRTITYDELERRLLEAARGLPLEPDEIAYVAGVLMPDAFVSAPPAAPTAAVPGSAEKVAELEARARAGADLFSRGDDNHPEDRALLVGRHDGNGATVRLGVVGECCTAPDYRPRGQSDHRNSSRPSRRNPPGGGPDAGAEGLLSQGPLARRLGVSVTWVRRRARRGEIPWTRDGRGHRLFDEAAVRAALEAAGHRLPS